MTESDAYVRAKGGKTMKKRVVYASLSAVIFAAALVVFLLVSLDAWKTSAGGLGLFFFVLMSGFGVLNLAWGLTTKSVYFVMSSALLLMGTFIYCGIEWAGLAWYVIVIVSVVILVLVGLLSFVVVRWASQTEGRNDAPDYKNYEQRKEETAVERANQIEREKKIAAGEDEEFKIKSFKQENKDE